MQKTDKKVEVYLSEDEKTNAKWAAKLEDRTLSGYFRFLHLENMKALESGQPIEYKSDTDNQII